MTPTSPNRHPLNDRAHTADEHHVPDTTPTPETAHTPWWSSRTPATPERPIQTYTLGGITKTGLILITLILGVYWVLVSTEVQDVTRNGPALAYKQTTNALIGGCGPIYTYPNTERISGTVPAKDRMGIDNRQSYPTIIPMFGKFWETPVDTKDQNLWGPTEPKAPLPEQLLANMWRGSMVVYYTPNTPKRDLETLKRILRNQPELDLIVVPWNPARRGTFMPDNRTIAFATWNHSQTCHQFIAPALYDFRKANPITQAPGADGTKPRVISSTPPVNVRR